MKIVFQSSSDVIHLFAQQTQSEGRCSNVFFKNDTIYSYGYHYTLGKFLDKDTILINDRGYSSTTSKHIYQLSAATSQYRQFFTTKTDISLVYSQVLFLKDKLVKARKPENYVNEILHLWNSMNEYIKFVKDKNVLKDSRYKDLKKLVGSLIKDPSITRQKLADAKKKQEEQKKKRDEKFLKESLNKFEKYEIDFFRIGNTDYLRLSKDLSSVETSQKVKVSLDEAKTLYKLILKGVDIKGHRISNYTVKSINGKLTIGCHNIDMKSVHSVGKKLLTI